jgi:hypothetical protein
MRDSGGDGEAPGEGSGAEIDRLAHAAKSVAVRDDRPDLSPSAVNARLAAFVAEHREAQARGDPRALRESDRLLAAWAEDALQRQDEAESKLAEADAKLERMEFDRCGGRLQ